MKMRIITIFLCSYSRQVEDMSHNIIEIESKLDLIAQAQNDIITQPASSNKGIIIIVVCYLI